MFGRRKKEKEICMDDMSTKEEIRGTQLDKQLRNFRELQEKSMLKREDGKYVLTQQVYNYYMKGGKFLMGVGALGEGVCRYFYKDTFLCMYVTARELHPSYWVKTEIFNKFLGFINEMTLDEAIAAYEEFMKEEPRDDLPSHPLPNLNFERG